MRKEQLKNWFKAALIRALRTFAQTAAATIGAAALISDVSWVQVLSASALAAVLSLLMSVGGLPEVKEGE
ncbi:holin [Ruminococcus sp.]|uniref:holin n=1 Tax=Ruminococcus sp. TaxID=41978 RepID=UPI00292DA4FA|nr:holin [uncultured Ruminococcus sp.]